MTKKDWSSWDKLDWRRRLETFGEDDGPIIATGPKGEIDGVCQLGELTDKGRETTLALGQRLRHLYVDQLGFMPKIIRDADMIYLRATPMARALESLQESFVGMYPLDTRTGSFPPPTIITRASADETLFPNETNCRRFSQLSRAFGQRTADRWNKTTEMDYLNNLISKWMPEDSKRVAVDSHPRLSGIMDTINSTLAHGPETRLPAAFYDPKGREIIDKIGVEEWFSGFRESNEYRTVGIGGLVGDVVSRMIGNVVGNGEDGILEVGGDVNELGKGRGDEKNIRFGMSGCHDTTLAAVLNSLGAFENEKWPPYTSHIAVELFRKTPLTNAEAAPARSSSNEASRIQSGGTERQSFWSSLFGAAKRKAALEAPFPRGIARQKVDELSAANKKKLDGYYVRVRYNDRAMVVPGCKAVGNHLDGDESFCTLEAFKRITDKFTPRNWKQACAANLDQPAFPAVIEEAGY
ncbi:hypothetical protein MMC17_002634 [Xylographa soralifera]|nr:hypothetical protein [Xylographa soralifera]